MRQWGRDRYRRRDLTVRFRRRDGKYDKGGLPRYKIVRDRWQD